MGGYSIIFEDRIKGFIESPPDSKLILKGPTGSGKSTILLERYKYLVEKLGIPSEKILILLLNRTQSLQWRSKTILEKSGAVWRTSYYGFIQNELKTYYPFVLRNSGEILNKRIKPVFLTFESAQFLVSKVIERNRDTKGIFSGITSYNDRIAIDLTANLVKATTSDIPYNEIGDRLYKALELKNDVKKQIYKDADDILAAYRKKCMELGIFDFGMAVELYNNCLLKDRLYIGQLKTRINHLIVDNLEECTPTEIDFIDMLIPDIKSCILGFNHEGGYGEIFGSNFEYTCKKILDKYPSIELQISQTSSTPMQDFSDKLYRNIERGETYKVGACSMIERMPACELRSDMLEETGKRVCRLLSEEGYKPSDIVILSTHADPVTEFVIGRVLEKEGYCLKNLSRKNRVVDNPFSQALITLAHICHPQYGIMPNRDDVKALIRMMLKIDPVRSSMLAGEICSIRPFAEFPDIEFPGLVERIGYFNIEKYEFIRTWISEYKKRESPLPINEFFQRVFLELLLSKEATEADILQAKNLIDSSQSFVEIVTKFNRNASRDFLDMVRGGIKAAESIFELEEKLNGEFVLLSTPMAYLASPLKSKVTVITSLNSENWTPRSIKELTNVHVLSKTWNVDEIYTEETEEHKQKHYLAVMMRAVLKRCGEKLITLESNLSANGFENNGILSDYFYEMTEDTHGT